MRELNENNSNLFNEFKWNFIKKAINLFLVIFAVFLFLTTLLYSSIGVSEYTSWVDIFLFTSNASIITSIFFSIPIFLLIQISLFLSLHREIYRIHILDQKGYNHIGFKNAWWLVENCNNINSKMPDWEEIGTIPDVSSNNFEYIKYILDLYHSYFKIKSN